MADNKLIGQNYTTPDLVAKVTGKARYAEDYRADGMLFCKLLLSPMPHARVRRIDSRAALAMPGVKAILTADDLPKLPDPLAERCLTNEPLYQGEPILAIAAIDEVTAADAIEKIELDLEPLPFVIDPLDALRPNGSNARTQGNVWKPAPPAPPGSPPGRPEIQTLKWTDEDFEELKAGRLPMGRTLEEWSFGDVDGGFKDAAAVIDESFVVQSTSHQTLETRSAMAYWQNGKVYCHVSTQSVVRTVDPLATWLGIDRSQVVVISAYTGGGFGSKGFGAVSMAIPALLAKKANAPVMMRISREEEQYIGRARCGLQGRVKAGFAKDGRILAVDMFVVHDNGPYGPLGDHRSAGTAVSLTCQPKAMRWRGVSVFTNTPARSQQRSPGAMQGNGLMEPVLTKASKQLGIDQVELRRINAPEGKAIYGPPLPNGRRGHVTFARVKEALDKGAELFKWDERKARAGKRSGSKVRGVGVAIGPHGAGSLGFDGLMTIRPDGKLYVQSGIGNHGAHSVFDVARVAADVIGMPWDKVEVNWGDTGKGLPWTCPSVGSQTTHAMTRANYAGAMDLKRKLQEIAVIDLGGSPEHYEVGRERVYRRLDPTRGLTFAQAAKRAIALGGRFDGHELPEDINPFTKTSAANLVGLGLMGVAKDNHPRDGDTWSFIVGFAEVEVDVETGQTRLVDYLGMADVGTVVHPHSLGGQICGGSCLGIGHALTQRLVYDKQYGVALAKRFHHNKPLTILDIPPSLQWGWLDLPDPETPVGARGTGEPPVGAGYGSVMNAIADAVGVDVFRRSPVTADVILMSLEHGKRMHPALTAHV